MVMEQVHTTQLTFTQASAVQVPLTPRVVLILIAAKFGIPKKTTGYNLSLKSVYHCLEKKHVHNIKQISQGKQSCFFFLAAIVTSQRPQREKYAHILLSRAEILISCYM